MPKDLDTGYRTDLESQIPSLTYDINEAEIVLGKLREPDRARWELKRLQVFTEDIYPSPKAESQGPDPSDSGPPVKRRRVSAGDDGYTTVAADSQPSTVASDISSSPTAGDHAHTAKAADPENTVKVVKLNWFLDCREKNAILPLDDYVVYKGQKVLAPIKPAVKPKPTASGIWERALRDGHSQTPSSKRGSQNHHAPSSQHDRTHDRPQRPHLEHETTSEHDRAMRMPPVPDFLHTPYSCQRPTLANPPNAAFIEQLKEIRTVRAITGDKTGVRAYSTAISTLAAYPHQISCVPGECDTLPPRQMGLINRVEVQRLPGCSTKIAALWDEWRESGSVQEVEASKEDPRLSVLRLFYNIWGVAETTAREFYNRGWRDLDDIIEFGWDTLTRVQQIGIKYYDEFQLKISRAEVESIAQTILQHADEIHNGFQMVIVGGYRRGKKGSGDVDVVLSHPDPDCTLNFIESIVDSLESGNYATHTLTLSTKNSERGQVPVSWKGEDRLAGSGFDTLDKALVVWQEPTWDELSAATAAAGGKNPNPHRRVDIIISPWATAGCAVLGWSGATTFERDLRRYAKHEKQLKFDSSGVRSRVDGRWVDVESDLDGPAPDMLTAEKRVFSYLGLEWRPPEERCTDG